MSFKSAGSRWTIVYWKLFNDSIDGSKTLPFPRACINHANILVSSGAMSHEKCSSFPWFEHWLMTYSKSSRISFCCGGADPRWVPIILLTAAELYAKIWLGGGLPFSVSDKRRQYLVSVTFFLRTSERHLIEYIETSMLRYRKGTTASWRNQLHRLRARTSFWVRLEATIHTSSRIWRTVVPVIERSQ